MRREKLVTATCALGILACGACFLPPPGPRATAPPRRIDLGRNPEICVVVTNQSATHHIDPDVFARSIIDAINDGSKPRGLRARLCEGRGPGEALLQVSLLNETAVPRAYPQSSDFAWWTFMAKINATLAASDGAVVSHLTNEPFRSNGSTHVQNSDDPWLSPGAETWIRRGFSASLVRRMLNGNP